MDSLRIDVTWAWRTLRRHPLFAVTVTLTLMLAVGAATAVFAVVYGVLLKPLPIRDQDRVIILRKEQITGNEALFPFAVPELRAYAEQTRTLDAVGGVQYDGAWPITIREGDRDFPVSRALVSGDFFRVLDVNPMIGRALNVADDVVGGEHVAVISESLWRQEFGSDPDIVGHTLRSRGGSNTVGTAFTVVGVMPLGLEFPGKTEMWTPTLTELPAAATNPAVAPFTLVGRLGHGATVEQARAEVGAFLARQTYGPGEPRDFRAGVRPIKSLVVGEVRPALLMLTAAVALLMALATVNVANLFLVRGVERLRDFAMRAAIGASRARIAGHLVCEGLVLGTVGGAGGIFLAWSMVRGLVALAPPELPRLDEIGIAPPAVAAAGMMAILSALVFSLAPAVFLTRGVNLTRHLRAGGRVGSTDRAAQRGGHALAIAQVAMAVLVLVGAGLLLRTLARLQMLDMGFAAEGLTTARFNLPSGTAQDRAGRARLQSSYQRVLTRLEAIPGVSAATLVLLPPFGGVNGWDASYTAEGQSAAEAAQNPQLDLQPVLPGYFRTMGIPVRRGRAITEEDREGADPVLVVGEGLARHAWPGLDPVGKRIKLGSPQSAHPWRTVVGVVNDVRYRELTSPRPVVYAAWPQTNLPPLGVLIVRGPSGRSVGLADLRRAARQEEPAAVATEASTMRQWISLSLTRPRFNAIVLSVLAVLALAVASVGVYGVMAAMVRQRGREIGIRVALGASPPSVQGMVLGRGLAIAAIGVMCGLTLALAGGRLLASVLYDVKPWDPVAIAGAAMALIGVTGVACYLPARLATRVDPLIVLKAE